MTYEEKLQEAKRLYETANSEQRYVLESLFPELIKSEDERTRKEILDYIIKGSESLYDVQQYGEEKFGKWVAWLEKQVHVDKDEIVKGIRRCVAISLINYIDANSKGMCLSNMECEGIENAIVNEDWDKVYSYMKKKLEKQGEQKPADKVEPKFHKGDWVTDGVSKCQICFIDDIQYWYSKNCILGSIEYVDKQYHLWTIQDAKDGDVLAVEPIEGYLSSFVAIYKKQNKEDFDSYCFVGFDGKFYDGENGHSAENIHPATKEQRDTLFTKMKEAGYEWDAEKKELMKIEQNSAWSEEDEIEIPFGAKDSELQEVTYYIPKGFHAEIDDDKVVIKKGEKSAWSKEDDGVLLESISVLRNNSYWVLADKLKSLRPHSLWKPSEEQMAALKDALNDAICQYDFKGSLIKEEVTRKHAETIESLYNDLKKLKQ